ALALARAVRHGEWQRRDPGIEARLDPERAAEIRTVIDQALKAVPADGGWLDPDVVDSILEKAGLRVPRSEVVASEDEAVEAAAGLGGPAVLKVISESALHKSDVGGVVLGVQGEDDVRHAYQQVTAAVDDVDGVLVQEFVSGGHEVLIGMTQDPNFGPLVVFGLGGIYVELLHDVAFRIHPLTDVDAAEMMRETKGFRLLEGYRNQPRGDVPALESALMRVSGLISTVPELLEMDLNPVKILEPGDGVVVVDARMKIRRVEPARHPRMRDLPGVTS
ncbi:MAG: acetate--CoA ligase family protein, partial [Acidimicrobiia bacterium]